MELLVGLLIAAGLLIIYLAVSRSGLRRSIAHLKQTFAQEAAVAVATRSEEASRVALNRAQEQLAQWRNNELTQIRLQLQEVAVMDAQNQLAQWRTDEEVRIRQSAIDGSRVVIAGKVTEHFIPFLPGFPFNPKDVRFLGAPVDLVVFDGLDEGDLRRIVFVEVKTGASGLTPRERLIREAIKAGRIEWLEQRRDLNARPKFRLDKEGRLLPL